MAQTIQTQIRVTATGDNPGTVGPSGPTQYTAAGNLQASETQSIPTTPHTLLNPSELATPGVAYFANLDPTNYVQIGIDTDNDGTGTFCEVMRLAAFGSGTSPAPLSYGSFPYDGTYKLYAKANTGACKVFCAIWQR